MTSLEDANLSFFSGQSILLTGATGFIGRRLLHALLQAGARPVVLHRGRSALPPGTQEITLDKWTPSRLSALLAGRRFDGIFNLAAYGVAPGDRDADVMQEINIDCARALFGHACAAASAYFVHAGSSAEYAPNTSRTPLTETSALTHAQLYGASKARASELLVHDSQSPPAAGRTSLLIARIFGVYGPGEAPHRLTSAIWSKLRAGERVPLSHGRQMRDFLYVDDVAGALMQLAARASQPRGGAHVVNVCSGLPLSVADFARAFADALGASEERLGFGEQPLRPDDLDYVVGSPAKLHALTGWRPHFTLRSGLQVTATQLNAIPPQQ